MASGYPDEIVLLDNPVKLSHNAAIMSSTIKPQANKHAERKEKLTLTPREAARITGLGVSYTYQLLRSGEMPSIKAGKRFFIPKSALLRWLESAGSRPLSAA